MLKPGDIVLFSRLTLGQAWRAYGWKGIPTWVSNWIIAATSWYTEGSYDGYWELCHVGIVVRRDGELALLEYTATGGGMVLSPARRRLALYPGGTCVIPLAGEYVERFDADLVDAWISDHRQDRYRWGGLPFAILQSAIGYSSPGAMFCSEGVVSLLLYCGIIPDKLRVWRGNRTAEARVEPQRYAPCEVARLPQYQRNAAYSGRMMQWEK